MKRTVGSVAAHLANAFGLNKAAAWDPVGLQLGDPGANVDSVAVCHEVTPNVVDRLLADAVDMVITYHPLLFRPAARLVAGPDAPGRAYRLIRAGVSLVTVHTGFDVAPGGTADRLAQAVGIVDVRGIAPLWAEESAKIVTFVPGAAVETVTTAMVAAGAGRIGNYTGCSYRSSGMGSFVPGAGAEPAVGSIGSLHHESEDRLEMVAPRTRIDAVIAALVAAHPYEEPAFDVFDARSNAGFVGRVGELPENMTVEALADRVAERLGGVIRFAGSGSAATAAVIPGSGGSMLGGIEADVVITGDVSHHQARDAVSRGLSVIDPGHAATERPGVQALYAAVSEFLGSAIDMTDFDSDPWKGR